MAAEQQSTSDGAKRGAVALLVMTATAAVFLGGLAFVESVKKKRRRR